MPPHAPRRMVLHLPGVVIDEPKVFRDEREVVDPAGGELHVHIPLSEWLRAYHREAAVCS